MSKDDDDRKWFTYILERPTLDQLAKLKFARALDSNACFWVQKYVWIAIRTDAVDTKKNRNGKLIPYLFLWRVGDNPNYIDRSEYQDDDN